MQDTPEHTNPDGGLGSTDASSPQHWRDYRHATDLDDEILDVEVLSNGDVVAVGYERGTRGRLDPDGDARGWLVIFDQRGEVKLNVAIDAQGSEAIDAVIELPETHEILIAGHTTGSMSGQGNYGQHDVFAALFDPASRTLNSIIQYGTQRPEHPRRIAIDSRGGAVLAGYTDIFIPTNYVARWEERIAARIELGRSPMQFDWSMESDSERPDRFLAVATSSDASYFAGDGGEGEARGAYVEKRDRWGDLVWSRALTPAWTDSATAVAIDEDGLVLVAGSTILTLGAKSFGGQDAFVLALDPENGRTVWASQFGSSASELVADMAIDPRGHIFLAGETLGSVDPSATNQGETDVFAVELDSRGHWLGAWQRGTAGDDGAKGIVVDERGAALVAGYEAGARRDAFLVRAIMNALSERL